ncbi:hypothetical protein CAOG_009550 [Capsaspora owczarzaki ATCC 30864]|uniref:Uncharacterized protein n=1 Tax=Capsaspora owczarzaki (strain ATCC 30864) TaxID=595528 RepID=A0A0D2WLB1_CAPO3|nr:hypothetical protein CAOG_009550 [Capsaspora owczarzaki ATCC 30864]
MRISASSWMNGLTSGIGGLASTNWAIASARTASSCPLRSGTWMRSAKRATMVPAIWKAMSRCWMTSQRSGWSNRPRKPRRRILSESRLSSSAAMVLPRLVKSATKVSAFLFFFDVSH